MLLVRWIARAVLIAFLLEAAAAALFLLAVFDLVQWNGRVAPLVLLLSLGERAFEALGPAWPLVPLLILYASLEPVLAPFFTPRDVVASAQREAPSADRRPAH